MKRFLAALALAAMSVTAFAASSTNTVDISKLSPEQQQAVQQMVAKNESGAVLDNVDRMISQVERVSSAAAKGLITFAKEIGAEANTFAATPLGKIVTVGLIMYFAGGMITSFVLGVFILTVLFPTALFHLSRALRPRAIYQYEFKPVFNGLFTRKVPVSVKYEQRDFNCDGGAIAYLLISIAATVITFAVGVANFVI